MEQKITDLEMEMAQAFVAYKNAEAIYNFYKTQLADKLQTEGFTGAKRSFDDGTTVFAEFIPATQAKSFNQAMAKEKLAQLMGASYNEDDFYKVSEKKSYVKVSVNYAE